jgi:integrase/recombinase XerD
MAMKVNRRFSASVLTLEQWIEVWAEMEQPYRLATQVAYYCCERIGAVVQLRSDDIVGGYVHFRGETTKTGESKAVKVTPALKRCLDDVAIGDGYLFPGQGMTGHITTRAIEYHLKRAAELCGHEGVANHSPRRSRCTHLDEAGWTLAKISKISGHKSLASLERYIDRNTKEAEADLMVLDA